MPTCLNPYHHQLVFLEKTILALLLQFSSNGDGFQDGIAASPPPSIPYRKMLMFLTYIRVFVLYTYIVMTGNNRHVGD